MRRRITRQMGSSSAMRWTVHGERAIYESEWVRLALVDVEIPGGERFDHHVVRSTAPAAGCLVVRDDAALMLWRHRFITDTWGYEIPAGRVDEGETLETAARRECVEESGWEPGGALTELVSWFPSNGLSDQRFTAFLARDAQHVGEPTDASESERIDWVRVADLPDVIARGHLRDGLSLTAVLAYLAAIGAGAGRPTA
jgi:8-oxo-dGTP pyrophosphatase MutT (NUDIX family)